MLGGEIRDPDRRRVSRIGKRKPAIKRDADASTYLGDIFVQVFIATEKVDTQRPIQCVQLGVMREPLL